MYNRKLVFISACIGILFFGMAITTLGSVVPNLKIKFNLDDISAGTLFSILPFGILTGSLLFGPFADRYGYRVLLALTCFFMAAGFAGIAYSPTHGLLKICVFLFGLGGGAINGATSALVSDISDTDKGANLSILGVFFAIGALGMPFLLGLLESHRNYSSILMGIGLASFAMGIVFLVTRFPPAKHGKGLPVRQSAALLKNPYLLLIAFFLFFQSAFEGIMNNWTTTYNTSYLHASPAHALYVLSLFVVGMTLMRLLLGSAFRNMRTEKIWIISFSALFAGLIILLLSDSFSLSIVGFMLTGAGLAAGFPIMLGAVGEKFRELSGTAFSIAFTIALLGNMIINYLLGFIIQRYGIRHLITVGLIEFVIMGLLCFVILRFHSRMEKKPASGLLRW